MHPQDGMVPPTPITSGYHPYDAGCWSGYPTSWNGYWNYSTGYGAPGYTAYWHGWHAGPRYYDDAYAWGYRGHWGCGHFGSGHWGWRRGCGRRRGWANCGFGDCGAGGGCGTGSACGDGAPCGDAPGACSSCGDYGAGCGHGDYGYGGCGGYGWGGYGYGGGCGYGYPGAYWDYHWPTWSHHGWGYSWIGHHWGHGYHYYPLSYSPWYGHAGIGHLFPRW